MQKQTRSFGKSLILLGLSLTIAACGANKKVAKESGEVGEDITRPPQTIVGRQEVKERDPDETISFDEWRKKRLEELKQEQTP